ncbi:MAG: DUF2959 domain-containing protein [Pseudomonadales bacterium]|nr:DUF2959 domain-containing protein [Pseudomonadales bacterium]
MIFLAFFLSSCESAYYSAMEKVGIPKRDIFISRIEKAQESQEEGQQQFRSALEQFRSVVNFDGGDLEKVYEKLNGEFEDSEAAAAEISERIDAVESVAEALFAEWEQELDLYTNNTLRRESQRQLAETRAQYSRLIKAMRKAEQSMGPVLDTFRDNVLFLKHNLNARAISSLKGELGRIDSDVNRVINDMQKAINESSKFIETLRKPG